MDGGGEKAEAMPRRPAHAADDAAIRAVALSFMAAAGGVGRYGYSLLFFSHTPRYECVCFCSILYNDVRT